MKKILLVILLCLWGIMIYACTTFCINKNGHIVFGRNYDWITGAGIVHTNQRGLLKTTSKNGNTATISWVSKYGSITFNQYGKEFPTGGMNEKGLVVEMMWLDGTVYPSADFRPAIGVLQWIQYQLDNAATVAEVIASDKTIRIGDKDTPLHYLVADAAGNVASIEFLDGKMIVHTGQSLPFPVLTNNRYDISKKTAIPYITNASAGLPRDNSLGRFVQACSMVNEFQHTDVKLPITDFAFTVLDKVSQGDYTKWSIVYDISNKKIFFKTGANKEVKSFSFGSFNFECHASPRMYQMNQEARGDISKMFTGADKKLKQQVIHQAVTESSSLVRISKKEEESLLTYEEGISCRN